MTKVIYIVCALFVLAHTTLLSQANRRPDTRYFVLIDHSGKKVEELRIDDKIQISNINGSSLKGRILWIDTAYLLILGQQIKYSEIGRLKKNGINAGKSSYPVSLESGKLIDSSEYAIRFVNPAELPSSNHLVIYKLNKPVKAFYPGDKITYKLGTARQYYGVISRIEEDKLFFARGDSVTVSHISSVRNRSPKPITGVSAMTSGMTVLMLSVLQSDKEERRTEIAIATTLSAAAIVAGIVLVTSSWYKFEKNKSIKVVRY